ncbi:MAG: hypothetical protein RLZZ393_1995 [Pseudomonadota bacterium]|jgi:quinohemoprotein ethanol dehydrogenase
MTPVRTFLACAAAILATAGCHRAGPTPGQVDTQRLMAADAEPGSWMTSGRDFGNSHYSPLSSLNRDTIGRLGFAWAYQTDSNRGLQATPIVVDGVMYASGMAGRTFALDARNGREIWAFDPQVDGQISRMACCDNVNRGVAVWRGKVYVAALDGRLFALDAKTGAVLWSVDTIVDHARGYTSTGAPEIAGDKVVIGNAGGEYDGRGYVSAYDLEKGTLAWRFFTVPGDPRKPFEHPELEMAAKTWDSASRWEIGLGGATWNGMAYDPRLNLLYVATGNAQPWSQGKRSPAGGDNLFTCSVLALDASTGRLAWFYQEVPGDQWDYDSNAPMILADLEIEGRKRQVLMHAPKNGFFYVFDRQSGEVLSAKNFVPVNWTKGIDPKTKRPIPNPQAVDYRNGPKAIHPWGGGAHHWAPMAYSPGTGLVYLPVSEGATIMFDALDRLPHRPALNNVATSSISVGNFRSLPTGNIPERISKALASPKLTQDLPSRNLAAYLDAWDPVKQERVWRVEMKNAYDRGGVLATAGHLIVQGNTAGELKFFDEQSGALLHTLDVGTSIVAAPMTYQIDGEQYVAVMAGIGGGPLSFVPPAGSAADLRGNQGRVLAFKLGGGPTPKPALLPPAPPFPDPPPQTASADVVARGTGLFALYCGRCHANATTHGSTPDLRRMSADTHAAFKQIVLGGALRARNMPRWDDVLSDADAEAIHAYLVSIAWDAYRAR